MSILYIVATPIGNLGDLSKRALRVLAEVGLILCEDTRVTKKLLARYGIKTPTLSYHQHSRLRKVNRILELLREGKSLALVSDAGTPGISDPGNKLVAQVVEKLGERVTIVPIPGPSAVTCAASVAGFPMDRFLFAGFPPTKRKRKEFFEKVARAGCSVVFFESPHRIIKSLEELKAAMVAFNAMDEAQIPKESRRVVVCRELTKKFESIYRGTVEEVLAQLKKSKIKGEFVVIVNCQKGPIL